METAANGPRKRTYRRRKFRSITFKLSPGQYKSLRNYCKARRITPIKLIKRNIERFTTAYEYDVPHDLYVTENQLQLFDIEPLEENKPSDIKE